MEEQKNGFKTKFALHSLGLKQQLMYSKFVFVYSSPIETYLKLYKIRLSNVNTSSSLTLFLTPRSLSLSLSLSLPLSSLSPSLSLYSVLPCIEFFYRFLLSISLSLSPPPSSDPDSQTMYTVLTFW